MTDAHHTPCCAPTGRAPNPTGTTADPAATAAPPIGTAAGPTDHAPSPTGHVAGPADHAPSPAGAAPIRTVSDHPIARRIRERAVLIPAGPFRMGGEDADANPHDGEGPVRTVDVPAVRIDPLCVTNAEFAAFVAETGHVTVAERFGWSFVFAGQMDPAVRRSSRRAPGTPWWRAVEGARWDRPEGPGSDLEGRAEHPVVHVALADALALAAWCGMRLPREAEWEKAARGGLEGARYPWGNELTPGGAWRCNIFQGVFPTRNTGEDGHLTTAPVGSYSPNGLGLHDVAGNVWEWCEDAWSTHRAPSLDGDVRVIRGGSYLCHESYCNRYRVAARTSSAAEDTSSNKGVRLAADA